MVGLGDSLRNRVGQADRVELLGEESQAIECTKRTHPSLLVLTTCILSRLRCRATQQDPERDHYWYPSCSRLHRFGLALFWKCFSMPQLLPTHRGMKAAIVVATVTTRDCLETGRSHDAFRCGTRCKITWSGQNAPATAAAVAATAAAATAGSTPRGRPSAGVLVAQRVAKVTGASSLGLSSSF